MKWKKMFICTKKNFFSEKKQNNFFIFAEKIEMFLFLEILQTSLSSKVMGDCLVQGPVSWTKAQAWLQLQVWQNYLKGVTSLSITTLSIRTFSITTQLKMKEQARTLKIFCKSPSKNNTSRLDCSPHLSP